MAIVRAELDTLALFLCKMGEAAGVHELDGKPLGAWFMEQRRVVFEEQLLRIGDTDPALADYFEANLAAYRAKTGPDSILQPPQD